MLCPFCLEEISSNNRQCSGCQEELPILYVNSHSRRQSPYIISLVGFSGHGKTVYLASLLYTLQDRLTRVWPGFYRKGLNQDSVNLLYDNLKMLKAGTLPESTRRNFPKPSIHQLCSIPSTGDRQLLIYDPPGEAFHGDKGVEEYAGFVKKARVVLFLLSLVDMDEPVSHDMEKLLETYTLGMGRMGARKRKQRLEQHLVVVYTKADRLLDRLASRPQLISYLRQNEEATVGDVKQYRRSLREVSTQLADFTLSELGAHAFVNHADREFSSVTYCAVSALGSAPEDGRLVVGMDPHRVVDPLLWVMEKS